MNNNSDINDCTLVTRTFQPNATMDSFDKDKSAKVKFDEDKFAKFVDRLNKITSGDTSFKKVVVVLNGDTNSDHSERINKDKKLPSQCYLEQKFSVIRINDIPIKIVVCNDNWGLNAGSGKALNDGLKEVETERVMIWSAEMEITSTQVKKALETMNDNDLRLIGFLREGYKNFLPWRCVQNTAVIWHRADLEFIEWFDVGCDGTKDVNVCVKNQPFLKAGMEDFHAYLRLRDKKQDFKWGMIGKDSPIVWTHENDTRNQNKIARQKAVMSAYMNDLNIDKKKVLKDINSPDRHYNFI